MNIILLGIVLALGQVGVSLGAVSFLGAAVGSCVGVGFFGFILGSLSTAYYITRPIEFKPASLEKYLRSKGFKKVS